MLEEMKKVFRQEGIPEVAAEAIVAVMPTLMTFLAARKRSYPPSKNPNRIAWVPSRSPYPRGRRREDNNLRVDTITSEPSFDDYSEESMP